jgi:hypothetical protein
MCKALRHHDEYRMGETLLYAAHSPPCRTQSKQIIPFHSMIRSLIVTQLLQGIGAISTTESKKATSRSGNYQDSIMVPLGRAFDDDAAAQDDEDEQDELSLEVDSSSSILSAVEKAGVFFLIV